MENHIELVYIEEVYLVPSVTEESSALSTSSSDDLATVSVA